MRQGATAFVVAVVLAVAGAGVVAMSGHTSVRPEEQAVAANLDKLHAARPTAAHRRPTRFDLPDGTTTAIPSSTWANIAEELGRYLAAVQAARQQAFLQNLAASQASQHATPRRTVRSVSTNGSTGGGDFFACVRHHESRGNYGVVNGRSGAAGAYQFMPSTWNNAARSAGRADLVGVNPAAASTADQDAIARYVYSTQGARPWTGSGCG